MDKLKIPNRLEEIITNIIKVASGDYSVKIPLSDKNDELDSLTLGINFMIEDIKEREAELNINQELLKTKINDLEKNELATLNILEDFQNNIKTLEKIRGEIKNKNIRLESMQVKLEKLNNKLEEKVKDRTNKIEALLKQKDEFINQLGHDLKTPLTPLVTLLPLITKQQTDKKLGELLDICIKNVQYMQNLVIKTIQLARLNSPSDIFNLENTNLLDELKKIIENNKFLLNDNKITVENKVSNDIIVKADKLRLEELLNNLITNAVKYKSNEGTITIDAHLDHDFVTMSFKDNGLGLSKKQIKYIFDEFYKADPSRHDLESSGLGLPICKRIIEKHGGKMWAESPGLGKGSTFYFTLIKSKDRKNN
jgi:signal transduction histidine kinase